MRDLRCLVSRVDWPGRERSISVRRVDRQVVLVLPAGFNPRQLGHQRRALAVVTSPETNDGLRAAHAGRARTTGMPSRSSVRVASGGPLDVPLWMPS